MTTSQAGPRHLSNTLRELARYLNTYGTQLREESYEEKDIDYIVVELLAAARLLETTAQRIENWY